MTAPSILLRAEGAILLITSVLLYYQLGGSWLLFALLLFAPDLSMLGYLVGKSIGAAIYNLAHIYAGPATLALYGILGSNPLLDFLERSPLCLKSSRQCLLFGYTLAIL